MKKTLVVASLLASVFFYSHKVHAESVYQSAVSYTPLVGLCLHYESSTYTQIQTTDCQNNPDPFVDTVFSQELDIANGIAVSAVSFWIEASETNGGNRPATITAYLAHGQNKVATSTPLSWTYTDDQEVKLSFSSPYLVSTSTPVDTVLFEFNRDDGFPLFDTGKMNVRLTPNRYPPDGFSQSGFSGGYFSGLVTDAWYSGMIQLSDFRDLAIIVYDDSDYVTIDSPLNNATLHNSSLSLAGTCSDSVEVSVYSGISIDNPGTFYGSTRTCTGNAWTWDLGDLDPGFWNVSATVGEAHNGIVVLVRADSPYEELLPDFFSTSTATSTFGLNPFTGEEGGDGGFWSFLKLWGKQLFSGRPFVYVVQIANRLFSAFQNATASNPFPQITLTTANGGHTSTIQFQAIVAENIYELVPEDSWTSLRTLGGGILIVGFLMYLYLRIKNLL